MAKKALKKKRASAGGKGAGRSLAKKTETVSSERGMLYRSRYEIIFIIISVISFLILLSNFHLSGPVGEWINGVTFGLFGFTAWLLPVYIFFGAAFGIANRGNRKVKGKLISSGLFFVILSALMQLVSYGNSADILWGDFYKSSSVNKDGGGFFGGVIAKVLCSGVALTGAYVVLFALFFVLLIFLTDRIIINIINKKAASTREAFTEYRNEHLEEAKIRAEEREERKKELKEKRREERNRLREERRLEIERARLERAEVKKKEEAIQTAADNSKASSVKSVSNENSGEDMPKVSNEANEQVADNVEMKQVGKPKVELYIHRQEEEKQFKNNPEDSEFYMKELEEKFGKEVEEFINDENVVENGINLSKDDDGWESLTNGGLDEILNSENDEETEDENSSSLAEKPENIENSYNKENESKPFKSDFELEKENILTKKSISGNKPLSSFTKASETKYETKDGEENGHKVEKVFEKENIVQDIKSENALKHDAGKEKKVEISLPPKPYVFPPKELLKKPDNRGETISDSALHETAAKLQETLAAFGVNVKVTDVSCGPTVTRYELQPEQGVRVSKITSLSDDIKLKLAAADIRIEAPIPGKAAVGIEVPNEKNMVVFFRELIENKKFAEHQSKLAFAVGKDIGGQTMVTDIAKMPHLLIAGATGSGKSVCINTLIMSILYKAKPDEVKFIMVDPKVVELSCYNGIPHLLLPVVTDPKKAAAALNWAVAEMNRRYKLFAEEGVREIKGFNKKVGKDNPNWLPQIVIIVDELADLMMVSSKEVEEAICRLAQLARAAGIHLVIATQRPSVNVITGLIKANIPSRIAFAVSSQVDSRTILDGAGAEKLLGKGDMLFFPSDYPKPLRVQGAFVSDSEVSDVVSFIISKNETHTNSHDISEQVNNAMVADSIKEAGISGHVEEDDGYDAYFDEAGALIIDKDKASIGMLQRVYRIGFNRAARIMDQLAEAGVVSEEDGTKPRKVLMSKEEFAEFTTKRRDKTVVLQKEERNENGY